MATTVHIMSRLDDAELMRRMADGSPAALEAVLARHGRFIFRLAVELQRDAERAEETTVAAVAALAVQLRSQDGLPTRSLLGLLLAETFARCS